MKQQSILKSLLCLLAVVLCLPMAMQAKVEHLLPKVHSLSETKGTPFALQRAVTITDANNTAALKKVFTDYGCTIGQGGATVTVQMVDKIEGAYDYTLEGYDNEGYQLIVETNAITIKAVKPIGVIRAAQTLAQLAEGYEEGQAAIETVEITDWAAFKLRGYMHDVGRSFISVAELKKHIDLLSRFKVNTFHWHFTENQAWRFEVEGYPQLTSDESMTRFAGKYYTQAECREVAAYAHERGVTIIPEIDMPGHSEAFHRAMGFDMQTDEGVAVLKEVLTQVAAVFPNAPYIHIGADEKGITYPNFLGIMADHIHGLGRKMIVWNPISGVSINSNMCDMTQMWSSRGTDIKGVPDIDCRYNYTNHFDVFADVVGIYKSNIYYADKGSEEIAGTISAYWNDRKTPTEEDIVKQNNMYANVLASAERAWIGSKVNGAEGYIEKLGTTLPNSGEVYEEFKSWEERFLFHKANSLKDEPIPYVKQTNVRWRITDPFPNGGNSGATFAPDQYATSTNDAGLIPETFTHEGKTYYTGMATGAGIYLRHVWGNNIIPTYYGSTNHSNMTAYAWTYVYSPKAQKVGAQIEFQNYGRSEHDKTPNADKWDRKGSDIWINGTRINPPTWKTPGFDPTNEDDLFNENFSAREPIEVSLKQGWNKVFLKLPYVGADGIRLNKWMFTCVFTDLEGKNAVEGLIYSPNQCMDEATELVAAKISEIKRDRGNYVGTAVGLWPETAAEELDAKVEAIEATYAEEKSAEERAAQVEELETAWAAFIASLTGDKINLPVSGNYYRMYTPGRDNRYPTSQGVGNAIVGEQNPATKASIWQFVSRGDNSYDIINLADGSYISPASNNNTAINTIADKPNAGWTIKSAGAGKVIVTSGTTQFNQTNSGQGYKLYNWGYNSNGFPNAFNTSDGGCLYELLDVTAIAEATPIKSLASYEEFENGGVYSFVTERGWMGATASSNNAISTAKTTVSPAASADNPYFQWTVYQSKNGNYYLYNIGKEKFMGVQSSNNASVPLVDSPAGKLLTFKNSSSTAYPIMLSTDNVGVVNHTTVHGEGLVTWTDGWSKLDDAGSNHKVALICSLDDEALAKIANIVEAYDVFEENTPVAPQPIVKIAELDGEAYPYAIDAAEAAKVFAKENITIALDVTMPASLAANTRYALVCAADPTQNVTGATKTNSPYVAYGLNGSNPAYLPSSAAGDKFTYRDHFSASANTNYKVVYVIDKTNKKFSIYINGILKDEATYPVQGYELQSFSNFASNANAKLYLGGGIVNNTTAHDKFGGAIHSVQFFDKALSAKEVAAIAYGEEQEEEEDDIIDTDQLENTPISSIAEFENGGVYTFVSKRGWMGADKSSSNVISTARTTVDLDAAANNKNFQWLVYQSARGNYYLYNIGKKKFMGVQSANNTDIPFVDSPAGKTLTFKQSSSSEYPIMFSTDNAGVVNHSTNHGGGLINWTGGWNTLDDDGSNHKVTRVKKLAEADYEEIANLIEAYDAFFYVITEVGGLKETNPNTHYGSVRATSGINVLLTPLKRGTGVVVADYDGTKTATIDFARAYRGFVFQGFFLGEESLGKCFTLTAEIKAQITEKNPLIAKFTTTDDVTLFYDDDEFSYRIPAIATTSTGRLIAVSDYRHNLDDIGRDVHGTGKLRIDLVMRYSDDNGKTWSDKQTIAEGTGNKNADGYDCAYGDAAIATVGQNVLVMAAAGNVCYPYASADKNNRTVRVFSADNGATWTKEDITEKMFIGANALIPNGHAAFFGSGKLAVDTNFNGTGKARIYGAMLVKNASTTTNIYPIYTDDLGQNWKILGGSTNPVANADEPKVEILPNGQILLSARRQGGRVFRVFTYGTGENDKTNGAGSWGEAAANGCNNGGSNGTNGEIYCIDAVNANGDAVKLLLQSQPKGGSGHYDRKDVTIWYKEVDANTTYTTSTIKDGWTEGLQVSTQQSSYSAMALQKDGKIAFFFEEAPCYGDDYTKGYCMVYVPLTIEEITKNNYTTPEIKEDEVTSADALPGDGTLRFYRLAIPVTKSAYETDLESNNDKVKAFWQECEDFVNQMFVPLGFCFDVVEDKRLVNLSDLTIGNSGLPEIGNCTSSLNNIIGEANYDVAMWVIHRDDVEENSGLSAVGGAYTSSQKGNGYAKTDKWVVAHELGHMFGAVHTSQGEGSLMDNIGEYFSYPSIKAIRNSAIGTTSYNNVKVTNNAPQFDTEKMQKTYRIPQGACLVIDVQVTDIEDDKVMYTAIGCNSANVDNVQDGESPNGVIPVFRSFAPQESNIISYVPVYTADAFYEEYFYLKDGTGIHEMEAGSYPLSILVNDVPSTAWSYAALAAAPFYSTYAIWETQVEIVEGDAFKATIAPDETAFTAGEEITVKWGVNEVYFSADSKVRISLSTDYGKTFKYVLAESVEARAGECTVTLPNVNIGQVDVDFTTAVRKMNGGVIKVEEIGGAAYTLTVLDPNNDKGFTVTGGVDESDVIITTLGEYEIGTFYANEPMTIPAGVTAYVATTTPVIDGTEGTITMTAINDGIIPAETGAVIRGAAGQYVFTKAATEGTGVTGNLLHGYAGTAEYAEVALPEDGSVNYVLTVQGGKVGFYKKASGFKVYNNKAYLNVPQNVRSLAIRFEGDGSTSIDNSKLKVENSKIVYDLQGRRVLNPAKGVYIVNGKKVIVK